MVTNGVRERRSDATARRKKKIVYVPDEYHQNTGRLVPSHGEPD